MLSLRNKPATPAQPVAPATAAPAGPGNAAPAGPTLPTSLTGLAVSWLNGRFAAVAVQRGVVTGRWVCPETHDSAGDLAALLREAVSRTGHQGTTVQMVIAHPRLNQLWLEVPEVGGPAVQRFLQRQAQQAKSFEGPAAFSSQPTITSKLNHGLLLHLLPQELIGQMERQAEAAGLILTSLLPVAALVQRHLAQLPLDKDELAVLAVELGAQTVLVVGRKNGEICLARTLNEGWTRNAARFAAEVNRTSHFVGQQFALNPASVWLSGDVAPDLLGELQRDFPLPVRTSPVESSEVWWAEESLRCPAVHPANLVGRERLAEPKRRRMLLVTLAVVALLVVASSAVVVGFHFLRVKEQRSSEKMKQSVAQLSRRFQELTVTQAQLTNYQAFIREAVDGRPPPVPAWFLGHLGDVVGPDLLVTNLVVRAAGDHWRVELAGRLPDVHKSGDSNRLAMVLGGLTNRLARGPFHVRFPTGTAPAQSPIGALNAISLYWIKRGTVTGAPAPVTGDFRLEGRFP